MLLALVVGGVWGLFHNDVLGTKRARANYNEGVRAFKADLNGRVWVSHKIRTGEGYYDACVVSGFHKEITDYRRDVIEETLQAYPLNTHIDVTFLHPGDVVWVPVGRDD